MAPKTAIHEQSGLPLENEHGNDDSFHCDGDRDGTGDGYCCEYDEYDETDDDDGDGGGYCGE